MLWGWAGGREGEEGVYVCVCVHVFMYVCVLVFGGLAVFVTCQKETFYIEKRRLYFKKKRMYVKKSPKHVKMRCM